VRKYGLLVALFVKKRIRKVRAGVPRGIFRFVTPHQQLRFAVFAGSFDLLDSSNVFVPYRLPSSVERPLEKRADLAQLFAVDNESALDLVCGPMLALNLLATVEG
jgi:hypothetical protein